MIELTDLQKLKIVKDYIAKQTLAVLSTVDNKGFPQAAVVGFSETEDFEIIFGTFSTARKYQNLKTNPFVALVIGWDRGKTVQLEGEAQEISNPAEIEKSIIVHLSKIPSASKFLNKADERIFKIKPKWVRYSDLSIEPWEVFEINF